MIETSLQAAAIKFGDSQTRRDVKLSQSEQIASQIRDRLKPIAGVESALLEDLGETINVYIGVNSFRNTTLHPIFDAQYDIESDFMHISFHFHVNYENVCQPSPKNFYQLIEHCMYGHVKLVI